VRPLWLIIPFVNLRTFNAIAAGVVILCWPVYLILFVGRRKADKVRGSLDLRSSVGIFLQATGVALVWWPRPGFTSILPIFPANVTVPLVSVFLAVGSVWFSYHALQALGVQWSFLAKVRSNHQLVRSGPYAIIRHPLYACFTGLTAATGLVWTAPRILPVALGVFLAGVWIRIRVEEGLLRKAFGKKFDDYAREVPAILPRA
jgi:protein-S-isoprenylcysteine O-methyltransferase Ste14